MHVTARTKGVRNEATDNMRGQLYTLQLRELELRQKYPDGHPDLDRVRQQAALPNSRRLCRLNCGRPLAFRQVCISILGYAQLGRSPEFVIERWAEARSASAHQSA